MSKKVLLVGGGTGGHVMPLLAVASKLRNSLDIVFVVNKNNEVKWVEEAGFKATKITGGKLRRYASWENVGDIFKVIWAFLESLMVLAKERPNVVLAKGGYVSLPMAYAAWICRIPVIMHESDAEMGLANKLIAKVAKIICVAFEDVAMKLREKGKVVRVTGNPVRKTVLLGSRDDGRQLMGFIDKKPVVVILGGSQGALKVNEAIKKYHLELLRDANVFLQAGVGKLTGVERKGFKEVEFIDKMGDVLAAADYVIARAGANTMTELALLGKRVILVPLESSANNHQYKNAKAWEDKEAVMMVEEKNIETLIPVMRRLIKGKARSAAMSRNIKRMTISNADTKIAELVKSLA